jgi:hypothetical protein
MTRQFKQLDRRTVAQLKMISPWPARKLVTKMISGFAQQLPARSAQKDLLSMDEIEVPLEKVQEDLHHSAHHASDESKSFMNRAALISAFLAVTAAISALFAGHYANEAMIEQIQSSDHWAYFQAKGIKLAISELRQESNPSPALSEKIEGYKREQTEIKEKAEEKERESKAHLRRHESLAASVTFFQVAIALTAIAALTKRKYFLFGASTLGLVGLGWMIKGFFFLI